MLERTTLVGLLMTWASACSTASPGAATGPLDAASDTGTGASAFVGTWSCSGAPATLVVTAPPSAVGSYAPSATAYLLRFALNADGSLTETVLGVDGGVFCTKQATVSGSTASFAGQSCPLVFNGTTLTETFTSGTLTLDGTTMTEVGHGAVAGTVPDDGGMSSFVGSVDFTDTCTKQ
jgi:hypothetical protein